MQKLRKYIRQLLIKEIYDTSNKYDDSGASTAAANDLILYLTSDADSTEYARKQGSSHEDMVKVFYFTLNRYKKDLGASVFQNHEDQNDGSNDPETVMYDFLSNYPTHYVFPDNQFI